MISSRIAVGEERFIEKRISVITNFSEKDAIAKILLKKFSDTLNGDAPKDMVIKYDYYWSEGSPETAKIHAKKIVSSKPDVIFAATTPVVRALLQETKTIPIVFATVADPVGSGFVESLAIPGKNVTGFVNSEGTIAGKWVQFLKELVPEMSCVSMIYNPNTAPYYKYYVGPFNETSKSLNVLPILSPVLSDQEIENLIYSLSENKCGLVLMNDSFNFVYRQKINTISEKYGVPVAAYNKATTLNEALVAYGPEESDAYKNAAKYVKKIIDGAQVNKLPVQLNTKFYLSINLQKAKKLGIKIPASFLSRVDDEVE
ncbi:ABC transporter substrate-binding protein [Methylobacterium sp. CB376]|uniref:ABC transporter substrate-binding protein n=1 Tax=unclassified Methylobacterium TaxID=2615210 RepID=UPI00223F84D8|nr:MULTISPECIES: ABC transporter substrate-binding protein [Methylobacterium]WFT80149.1 ABC transporter substrate-binding protein [Methylobacterium nodulans]